MSPAQRTNQLLERYLPTRDGRTPAQRLAAIAGRALHDARRRVPELTPTQAEDAYGQLLEAGTRAAHEYDPDRDAGTGTVSAEIRFGRFAYVRMRQRFTDWYRREIHDNRPGKSDRRTIPFHTADQRNTTYGRVDQIRADSSTETLGGFYQDDADTGPDFTDLVASDDRVERWTRAAELLGFDLTSWVLTTLDEQAQATLDQTAA